MCNAATCALPECIISSFVRHSILFAHWEWNEESDATALSQPRVGGGAVEGGGGGQCSVFVCVEVSATDLSST